MAEKDIRQRVEREEMIDQAVLEVTQRQRIGLHVLSNDITRAIQEYEDQFDLTVAEVKVHHHDYGPRADKTSGVYVVARL